MAILGIFQFSPFFILSFGTVYVDLIIWLFEYARKLCLLPRVGTLPDVRENSF